MNLAQNLVFRPGAVALMLLMAATRFHHFGDAWSLPDASLAVFYLAGLGLGGPYLFLLLLTEAGVIDFLAINQLGVSDYCVSAAYIFLLPTYAAMWLGGQWSARFSPLHATGLIRRFVMLLAVTSLAFLISDTSFYLLSGRVAVASWAQYLDGVASYYPSYLLAAVMYVVAGHCVLVLGRLLLANRYPQRFQRYQ